LCFGLVLVLWFFFLLVVYQEAGREGINWGACYEADRNSSLSGHEIRRFGDGENLLIFGTKEKSILRQDPAGMMGKEERYKKRLAQTSKQSRGKSGKCGGPLQGQSMMTTRGATDGTRAASLEGRRRRSRTENARSVSSRFQKGDSLRDPDTPTRGFQAVGKSFPKRQQTTERKQVAGGRQN